MLALTEYFDRTVAALASGARPAPPDERLLDAIDGLCSDAELDRLDPPGPYDGLHVLLTSREYPPETAHGGMATFTYQVARGLSEAGHRVSVLTQGGPRVSMDVDGRVRVVRIQPTWRGARRSFESLCAAGELTWAKNVFFYSLGLYKQLRALQRRGDAFDVIDMAEHAAEAVVPALFTLIPRTVRLYSPWSLLYAMRAGFTADRDADALRLLERAVLERADSITSPSRELAARVQTFFGLTATIGDVPNPVDTDRFSPAPVPHDGVRVCFVGRLEERKGIRTLIAAIPRVAAIRPDIAFRIVGRDMCGIRRYAGRSLAGCRVRFDEPVPLFELPGIYRESDIAVVPSNYDNSPYTAIEPMACGIPVVATHVGGIPEYVADGETGIVVPPHDADALAEAILRLADDAAIRSSMGNAGRRRVRRLLDYRVITTRVVQEYLDVIARRATCSPDGRAVPTVRTARPERLRFEVFVTTATANAPLAAASLDAIQQLGGPVRLPTVLVTAGPCFPRLPGAVTLESRQPLAAFAAETFASVLADFVVVLPAGALLPDGFFDRVLWTFVAWPEVGALRCDACRVFRAAALRGFRYESSAQTWEAVLDDLSRELVRRGWRETGGRPAEPPPIAPLDPDRHRHDRGAWVARVSRRIVAAGMNVAFHPRLGPMRRAIRHGLDAVPAADALTEWVLFERYGRSQMPPLLPAATATPAPGPLVFAGSPRTATAVLARLGQTAHATIVVLRGTLAGPNTHSLETLVPPALFGATIAYFIRTRVGSPIHVGEDFPRELIPLGYERAMSPPPSDIHWNELDAARPLGEIR